MSFITAAMIGLGGAVVGGAIASSGSRQAAATQADAATNAANIQSQSADKALALQEKLYNQQVGLQEPYRQAGLTGQNRLMELLGLGGNAGAAGYGQYARDFGMSDFQADPGYAFRLAQGQKALDQQAAARGGLISGNALKAATGYGQDMASQEYQNAFNRYQTNRANQLQPLGNLMASGQAAASNQGAAAGNYGTNAGNLITGAGNAIASGINTAGQAAAAGQYGAANTFANALNTGISSYQNQNNFNNWLNQNRSSVIPMQPGGGY
jgi:hypothetical protein